MTLVSRRFWVCLIGIVLFSVAQSGCSKPEREDVISRYPGGEKQVVAVYQGTGSDEVMIERQSYDESGELIFLEDIVNGKSFDWGDLHDELQTAVGLKNALQGDWYSMLHLTSSEIEDTVSVSGDQYTIFRRYRILRIPDESWEIVTKTGRIEFLVDSKYKLKFDDEVEEQERAPKIMTTFIVDFKKAGEFDLSTIILIDGRIEAGPFSQSSRYRSLKDAKSNLPTQEELDYELEEYKKMRRAAVLGDAKIQQEYPDFYNEWVGDNEPN